MSEQASEWTEGLEPEAKPKRSRGPLFWIASGCGCGCLGIVILLLIGGWFLSQAVDPEEQWPELREVVWFDERPEELQLELGVYLFGFGQFQLSSRETPLSGIFLVPEGEEEVTALLSQAPTEGVEAEIETTRATVQGREVDAARILTSFDASQLPGFLRDWADLPEGQQDISRTLRVDLSGPGGRWLVFDLMTANTGREPTEEDLQAFLEPFDVWREP